MVLTRICALFALVFAGACGQSLFDANGKPDGGGDDDGVDGPAVIACPTPCLGDSAADFDGTPEGTGGRWRYLEDRRDRTWAAMTPIDGALAGTDPANAITTCASEPGEAACAALPGALLVSSAGNASGADPDIAYPATGPAVIKLSFAVHVPDGAAAQPVRLYRNSREDVLLTATANAGTTLERSLDVEALPGDRFHLAISPIGTGAAKVGVRFFANETATAFPGKCQLAISFSAAAGTNMDNLCGADLEHLDFANNQPAAPVLGAGPFTELGMAADITPERYYRANNVLVKSGDTTVQLWVQHDALVDPYAAWAFSDLDLNDLTPGGLGIAIYDRAGVRKYLATHCTSGNPLAFVESEANYPTDGRWHFLRVVHTAGMVKMCLDGTLVASFAVPAGQLVSTYPPRIGKNVVWTPAGAFYDGRIDDVRVISDALPCE